MNLRTPEAGRAPRHGTERDMASLLARYVKYAALIRFQEEALEVEDLERFHELAREREGLQEELGEVSGGMIEAEMLDPEPREHLDRLHATLKEAVLGDARLRAQLQEMKRGISKEAGEVPSRAQKLKGYLERDEFGSGGRSRRLNLRL